MVSENIPPEVAVELPPDRVDVVGAVLGISVFEDEGRTLDPVVMRFLILETPGPGEDDLVPASRFDLLQIFLGEIGTDPVHVDADQVLRAARGIGLGLGRAALDPGLDGAVPTADELRRVWKRSPGPGRSSNSQSRPETD